MQLPQMANTNVGASSPPHAESSELARSHPRLAEAFTSSIWSDGTSKKPARLSLSIYGRRWVAQLDLIGTGLMVRVELPDPVLLYDALEAVLSLETVPWEKNPYLDVTPPRKGKKT